MYEYFPLESVRSFAGTRAKFCNRTGTGFSKVPITIRPRKATLVYRLEISTLPSIKTKFNSSWAEGSSGVS